MSEQLPITILIDTERSFRSVAYLIRSPTNPNGRVIRVAAHLKAKALETAGDLLLRHKLPQWPGATELLTTEDYDAIELITIDTLSKAADRARRELTGILPMGRIWDQTMTKTGLTSSQRDYGEMTDYLARTVEGIVSYCDKEGKRLLLLSHERKIEEEKGSTAPRITTIDFNQKLAGEVAENSDYVWRMWSEERPTRIGGVEYPRNTSFLRMTPSERKSVKMRIPHMYVTKLIDNLPNPTLPKIWAILREFGEEYLPLVFTIYGPWGCGKSTLGVSLSDPNPLDKGLPKPKLVLAASEKGN